MRVTVVSPERAIYDGEAAEVVAPAYDGLVGIKPGHAPFMTLLGEGVLTVRADGTDRTFGVRQGFLQVDGDVVRVVAEHVSEHEE
jgi:F-type H+-transporting ATPase subunit epsilon